MLCPAAAGPNFNGKSSERALMTKPQEKPVGEARLDDQERTCLGVFGMNQMPKTKNGRCSATRLLDSSLN